MTPTFLRQSLKGAHAVGVKYRHQSTFSPVSLLNTAFPPAIWTKGTFLDKTTLIRLSRILSKCRQGKSFLFNPHILNRNIILGLGNSPGTNAVYFRTAISSFQRSQILANPCKTCLDKGKWFYIEVSILGSILQNLNFSYSISLVSVWSVFVWKTKVTMMTLYHMFLFQSLNSAVMMIKTALLISTTIIPWNLPHRIWFLFQGWRMS